MEGSTLLFDGGVGCLGNSVAFCVLPSVTILCPCVLVTTLTFALFSLCLLTKMLGSLSRPAGIYVSKEHWLKKYRRGFLFIQPSLILLIVNWFKTLSRMMDDESIALTFKTVIIMLQVGN